MISIILVEPENPDNIGAVARALKNMGFSDLRLVKPPKGWRVKSKKLAMSAQDVLRGAKAYRNLALAIEDAQCVVGTSRREGERRGKFREFNRALKVLSAYQSSPTLKAAILFGKESKGLDNASLDACDWVLNIPSHEDYPSLNLSQAVMVVCFSLFNTKQKISIGISQSQEMSFLSRKEVFQTLEHFKQALEALNYAGRADLMERILKTFQGIFKRSGMLGTEAQMIKGLSRRIVQQTGR